GCGRGELPPVRAEGDGRYRGPRGGHRRLLPGRGVPNLDGRAEGGGEEPAVGGEDRGRRGVVPGERTGPPGDQVDDGDGGADPAAGPVADDEQVAGRGERLHDDGRELRDVHREQRPLARQAVDLDLPALGDGDPRPVGGQRGGRRVGGGRVEHLLVGVGGEHDD